MAKKRNKAKGSKKTKQTTVAMPPAVERLMSFIVAPFQGNVGDDHVTEDDAQDMLNVVSGLFLALVDESTVCPGLHLANLIDAASHRMEDPNGLLVDITKHLKELAEPEVNTLSAAELN